jgi:hypothetical protein
LIKSLINLLSVHLWLWRDTPAVSEWLECLP